MKFLNVPSDQCRVSRGESLRPSRRAFTIIEIALCLGIIGFALVAIIAVLPRGLDVQKRNREETIIGEDAEVWMSAIRNGAHGYEDLTNYVLCISNIWTKYDANYKATPGVDYFTATNFGVSSYNPGQGNYLLTNGARIIGLLSMPKLVTDPAVDVNPLPLPDYAFPPYQSNYVIAYVRAFSGAEVANVPQTNATILADAFIYRMIVENFPYAPVDTNAFCLDCLAASGATPAQMMDRTNLNRTLALLQANSHDFRLRFRWPVLPNGQIPNYGLLTFRSIADGALLRTNDIDEPDRVLFFVQPSTYVQVTNSP
ncbi:MAG TPA: type II secretion system protein [Verrucomicrobiae bacterium]|jgi:type II secretory pathway pseudopilin PulG|nr:type II secretion system protein [Verrucomicrobiae bacterium]